MCKVANRVSHLSLTSPLVRPQARNIAVCIEFRDSDEEDAAPLKVTRNLLIPSES